MPVFCSVLESQVLSQLSWAVPLFACFVEMRIVLSLLLCSCSVTEGIPPFSREIQPEELWLYKFHPVKKDRVPTRLMFVSAFHSYSAMKLLLNMPCWCLIKGISLFLWFKQSIALFAPLVVISLFTFLKQGGKEDMKEASLGKDLSVCFINIYIYKIYTSNHD